MPDRNPRRLIRLLRWAIICSSIVLAITFVLDGTQWFALGGIALIVDLACVRLLLQAAPMAQKRDRP